MGRVWRRFGSRSDGTKRDVAGRWGTTLGIPGFDPLFDMDRNGVIDIRDVMLVTSLWNVGG